MGLKEAYFAVEDKYYAFLDWLDRHGIPVYKVVDGIEAQNIPSFPIAVFLLALVVGGLFVFVVPSIAGGSRLTVLVQGETQNPLKGISVQLSGEGLSGDALSPRLTNEEGRATFSNLPVGKRVTITATGEGYDIPSQTIILDTGTNEQSLTGQALSPSKSILLRLYKTGTNELLTEPVQLSFSCSNNSTFTQQPTITNGQISLDVPGDCGALSAEPVAGNVSLEESIIDLEDAEPSLSVNITPTGNGELAVFVVNESGNGVSGLTVNLKSKFGDLLATKFTDTTGFTEFTGLVPDTYTLFISADGTYGELDSGLIEVNDVAAVQKTLTVQPASVGEVRLQLVDESSLSPVANAKVTLSRGTQILTTKTTNEGGQVTFSVSSTNNLTASIDHPTYLIKTVSVNVSTAGYTQIPLTKATLQNSQIVTVRVADELGQPVENAYVSLKKSPSGAAVGTNKITGASGTVVFSSIEEGTYFASAYKPGFSDQLRSEIFSVKARENVETSVKLVLGNGTVVITVKGFDGQPLAGATVQPKDATTHERIGGSDITTGVDGTTEITLRADKYAYFVVQEPNHLPFVTLPLQIKKGITQSIEVGLLKDIQKLEIVPLGTFVNGQPVLEESGLAPGQTYTIRFGIHVPSNSIFSEIGAHLRTGNATDGQTNPIQNDAWFIHAVRGAYSKIQKGTTYTPPSGLGIDGQHLTSADSKWVNVVFSSVYEGVTLLEIDATVKDTAIQGTDLPLYYRTWGKTGSYVRFPVDAVLGGSESVSEKQGLYANANLKLYFTGAGTHLCTKDFCLGLVAEDVANQLQTPLLDAYEVDVGTSHKLLFTFTSVSDNVFQDTSLIVQSASSAANLGAYEVTNAVGAKKGGIVQGNKSEIPVGIIQKNNVVFGFVNFKAEKDGTSKVKFSLVSNKKELFSRELLVRVNPATPLNVEIVPKAILPLLVNQLLVHVTQASGTDEIPLENATVSIYLNDTLLTSGFSDTEGVFPFELHEPNVNDAVLIKVEKAGYKTTELTVKVGSDLVEFVPNQVNETLIVNGAIRKTRDVRIFNLTSTLLSIKEIALTGDFEGLVQFDLLSDEIVGETLPTNGDVNVTFALSLTEKGQKLLNPKTLKGSLIVKTDIGETGKIFANALPLNVKIGFGGSVDVEDCLLVDPVNWDLFTDPNETKQLAFEIKNTCTVKGIPIRLTNLSAKIKQVSGDSIGTFTAVSGQKTTPLGSEFKTILDDISAGGEATITVSFTPASIQSGTAKPQLVFQATNLTGTGVPDLVDETVKINIVVTSLTKCVQVNVPSALEIDSCPINTGMGQLGNYFGQVMRPTGVPHFNPSFATLNKTSNPSGSSLVPSSINPGFGSYWGQGPFSGAFGQSGFDGLGNYSPQGPLFSPGPNAYPGMQGFYNNPGVDRFNYNQGYGGLFGCGGTEIRIENSCQSEVEINLDTDPNLRVNVSNFSLKPNQNQRVRIGSGYRIGKYSIAVNAHVKGSQEPSKEIRVLDVLIKSPTEVNQDCIQLSTSKFRFNDFIQKPVKGKVINKCYDSGVRLIPSSDTITIASFFNGPDGSGAVQLSPKGAVSSKKNSMASNIQLIGVETRGQGRDTIQELEFQIFPDFETYKREFSPFSGGGIGKTIADLKFFVEGQFYRVESYGTISVKYLDPYGGSQQKPFPVIFENLFKLAGLLDIGDGNPDIFNYQQCINPDALQFRNTSTQTGNASPTNQPNTGQKIALEFDDTDFKGGAITTYVTTSPNTVLLVGDAFCGGRDFISFPEGLTTQTLKASSPNDAIVATFKVADKHNIQVTINRPFGLQSDAVIEGSLRGKVTRVAVNPGTQDVTILVKITVKKGAKKVGILQLSACTEEGFEQGPGFIPKYGFDKIKWDWTVSGSPDCREAFCDATQFTIHLAQKVGKFNAFIKANQEKGLFNSPSVNYTTSNFIKYAYKTTAPITDDTSTNTPQTKYTFFQSKGGTSVVDLPLGYEGKGIVENVFNELKKDQSYSVKENALIYLNYVSGKWEELQANAAAQKTMNGLVILLDENKLGNPTKNKIQLFGAESVSFADRKTRMIWMFNEYKKFHDDLLAAAKNPPMSTTVSINPIVGSGSGPQPITPAELKTIYDSITDVVLAYPLPGQDSELENLKNEDIAYFISKAEPNGLAYADYGDDKGLRAQFIQTEAHLLPDAYNQGFFEHFFNVSGEGYDYALSLETGTGGKKPVKDALLKTRFKDSDTDSYTNTYTISHPGKYQVKLKASWTNDSGGVKDLFVQIPKSADIDFITLAEIDERNTNTQYAKNPFFYLPFNGKTVGASAKRSNYGTTTLVDASGKVRLGSKPFALETTTNGLVELRVNTYDTPTKLGGLAHEGEALPRLFRVLKSAENQYTLDYAPSRPIPLKLKIVNPEGLSQFQYGIRQASVKEKYEALNFSPILWSDCSQTKLYGVDVQNKASCNTTPSNQQTISFSTPGNAYTLVGLALLPPTDVPYFLDAQCAVGDAQIMGPNGTYQPVENTSGVNVPTLSLTGGTVPNPPNSVVDIFNYITNGKACGRMLNQSFDIIWDAKAVTPEKLTCQAP